MQDLLYMYVIFVPFFCFLEFVFVFVREQKVEKNFIIVFFFFFFAIVSNMARSLCVLL